MKTVFIVALTSSLLVLFQNCAFYRSSNLGLASEGGQGLDGMRYVSYAPCAGGQVDVSSVIYVARNLNSARMTVKNCQSLPAPQSIDVNALQLSPDDSSVFQLNGQVFDQQVNSGNQKVTIRFCQSAAAQARIWQNVGSPNQYFGSVTPLIGPDSGALSVQPPTIASPDEYVTVAGQTSQFDLKSAAPASLVYSLNGGAQVSLNNLSCSTQSAPSVQDGSANAPTGTPPVPNLFSGYAIRPPWKAAGVDYAVGVPSGTVLKDPSLISMPGVAVDTANNLIVVQTSNVTFDGYDFSLNGGYMIEVQSGGSLAVRNSNVYMIVTDTGAGNLTVEYSVFDGGGVISNLFDFIDHQGTGNLVVHYCWFKNYPHKGIGLDAIGAVEIKYNLFQNGNLAGTDQDGVYFGSGNYSAIAVDFNTIDQPVESKVVQTVIALYGSNKSFTNAEIGYNSIIAHGTNSNPSVQSVLQVGPGTLTPSTDSASVHDNFIDPTGSDLGAFWPGIGSPNIVYSNNIDMTAGTPLTTNP